MKKMNVKSKNKAAITAIIVLSCVILCLVILLILEASGIFYKTPTIEYPEINAPQTAGDEVLSEGDYQYQLLKDGGAIIVGCAITDRSVTVITLPETLGGHTVTAIGDSAFELMTWITRVSVPEGVTYIGENAFYGCCFLDVIDLPASLEKVQKNAFASCDYLSGIYYAGNKDKWAGILIGEGNSALSKASKFYQ